MKECRFSRNPSREPASDGGDGFAVGSGNVTRENIVEEKENKEECVCRSDR